MPGWLSKVSVMIIMIIMIRIKGPGTKPHIGFCTQQGVCLSLSLSLCPCPYSCLLSLSPINNERFGIKDFKGTFFFPNTLWANEYSKWWLLFSTQVIGPFIHPYNIMNNINNYIIYVFNCYFLNSVSVPGKRICFLGTAVIEFAVLETHFIC